MSDYISREEAMAFPLGYDHYDKEHGNEHFIYGVETYREWIESIPAADVVEERVGTWTEKYVDDWTTELNPFMRRRFYCSACGEWNTHGKSRYCPKCGAKMNRGDEDG